MERSPPPPPHLGPRARATGPVPHGALAGPRLTCSHTPPQKGPRRPRPVGPPGQSPPASSWWQVPSRGSVTVPGTGSPAGSGQEAGCGKAGPVSTPARARPPRTCLACWGHPGRAHSGRQEAAQELPTWDAPLPRGGAHGSLWTLPKVLNGNVTWEHLGPHVLPLSHREPCALDCVPSRPGLYPLRTQDPAPQWGQSTVQLMSG